MKYLNRTDYGIRRVPDLLDYLDHDPIQMMSLGRYAPMLRFAETVQSAMGQAAKVLKTSYERRDMMFVDVVEANASKAAALAVVTRHLGIVAGDVMAVGDNHNDLEMLEYSGTGVLMGNAEEPLKRSGFHITASNDEDGLAQAIEDFVLRR